MTAIVQISDLHFGAEDPVLIDALEEKIVELSPCVVAVCGDLTQKGRRGEFEAAARFLTRLPAPKLIAPGNHDTPLLNIFARIAAPFARHYKRLTEGTIEHYHGGLLAARTLNTARGVQMRLNWSLGVVDLKELRIASEALGEAPADYARALVCHHPLVTPAGAPLTGRTHRGEVAGRLLTESGVDLVLTGHLHTPFVEALPFGDGLSWAVGSGSAMSRRLRGTPASFNAIIVEKDLIRVREFHAGGNRFEQAAEHTLARRERTPSLVPPEETAPPQGGKAI